MATKTVTDPAPKDVTPKGIGLTLEDIALLADGTGNIPDDTAIRLQALICCNDLKLIQRTWRRIASHLEELHEMAEYAGVELLADGLYVFRILEQLRSKTWESTSDVLDPRLDVPFQELIAMARAFADRADGHEKAELQQLGERLVIAVGDQIGGDKFVELLIDRLLEVGEEAAEEALSQLVGIYRHRRAAAAGPPPGGDDVGG